MRKIYNTDMFSVILCKSWRVPHVRQEMLTLSEKHDVTPSVYYYNMMSLPVCITTTWCHSQCVLLQHDVTPSVYYYNMMSLPVCITEFVSCMTMCSRWSIASTAIKCTSTGNKSCSDCHLRCFDERHAGWNNSVPSEAPPRRAKLLHASRSSLM